MFKKRYEGGEGVRHMDFWGKILQVEEAASAGALKRQCDWWVQGTAKRPEWLVCHEGIIDHCMTLAYILSQMGVTGGF